MNSKPKIMFFDIETSPNVGFFWRPGYKVSLTHDNIIQERRIICISYKFEGEKKVSSLHWDDRQNDKKLLKEFSKILTTADVAIGHNGDAFDLKWIKGRLLFHGLPPVTNVQTIDTLKLVRQNFNLNSARLDYLAQFLFEDHKISTDYSLWKNVMAGDKKALKYMIKYCEKDVILLEEVFQRLLPYCDRLPISLGILKGGTREDCPACGGPGINYGFKVTRVGRYQKHQCKNCRHIWSDSRMIKEVK